MAGGRNQASTVVGTLRVPSFGKGASLSGDGTRSVPATSIPQAVPQDAPQGAEEIDQPDLLALGIGPCGVTNRHFANPPLAAGDLGRHFRLEAKAVLLD